MRYKLILERTVPKSEDLDVAIANFIKDYPNINWTVITINYYYSFYKIIPF